MKQLSKRVLSFASRFDSSHHQLAVAAITKDTPPLPGLSPEEYDRVIKQCKSASDYRLKFIQTADHCYPMLLICLGKETDGDGYGLSALLSNFSAQAIRVARAQGYTHLGILVDTLSTALKKTFKKNWTPDFYQSVLAGAILADYNYPKPSQKPETWSPIGVTLITPKIPEQKLRILQWDRALETASTFSKNISNEPANTLTPRALAKHTQVQFQKTPARVKIFEPPAIKKLGMHLFLSVNLGSDEPARLIEVNYASPTSRKKPLKVALVGKGLTFDSGGYSLKPSQSMAEMKFDMCGAATVLAATHMAATLKLPISLKTLVPATDNLVNGRANKPSDVVRSLSGQTVEIDNTDAEGRLILADAITYAAQWKPDILIDVATLTGAVCVALGSPAAGIMGNDPKLIEKLKACAMEVGERVWELPLFPEYEGWFSSPVADFRNVSTKKEGGASCAGTFLKKFVPESLSWVHVDIAGVGWDNSTRKFYPDKGASAATLMTLVRFLETLAR